MRLKVSNICRECYVLYLFDQRSSPSRATVSRLYTTVSQKHFRAGLALDNINDVRPLTIPYMPIFMT